MVLPRVVMVALVAVLQRASAGVGRQLDPGGPTCESVGVRCDAGGGLIRDSTLGLTEVVWVGPETRGIYVSSCLNMYLMDTTTHRCSRDQRVVPGGVAFDLENR